MKIAFISDIHGNSAALEAVLSDIKKREIEKVIVLGDICFRGPEPQRSLDLVRDLKTDVIKGNADEWVVRGVKVGEVPESALEMMNIEREWTCSNLTPSSIDYLNRLPSDLKFEFDGIKIHAYHATPTSLFDVVQASESEENLIGKMVIGIVDVVVYAHIHKPYIKYLNGKCIINIGSVGLPFDGMNKSSYMILEISTGNYQATIVRVQYDVDAVINLIKETNYPNKELLSKLLKNAKP